MALDRQSIERPDLPVARRGYDTAAVDAHLARIADEVEELRQAAAAPAGGAAPVAQAASAQVQAIVAAAEATAADIVRAAEEDAARIRDEALAPAGSARDLFLHTAPGTQAHVVGRLRELVGDV